MNLYRCAREHPDELEKELTFMLNSRLDFEYQEHEKRMKLEKQLEDIRKKVPSSDLK